MPCYEIAPGVKVNMADDRFLRKRIQRCPIDECMTEMAVRYEAYYGVTTYCCKCGDWWQDGELCPRPFARGWRKAQAKRFRRFWDQAVFGPAPSMQDLYPELGAA
jgi:hypothetical protein